MYFSVTTGTQAWLKKKSHKAHLNTQLIKICSVLIVQKLHFSSKKKKKSKQQPTVIFIQNANSPYLANKKEINA